MGRLSREAAVTMNGGDVAGSDSAVVQRSGNQRAVAASVGEASEIVAATYATAGQQRGVRRCFPYTVDQSHIDPGAGADPGEIDQENRAHACFGGPRRHRVG